MSPGDVSTPLAALVAGMLTSLHCIGMCGPLACSRAGGSGAAPGASGRFMTGYHSGRLLSYSALGALAGFFSQGLSSRMNGPLTQCLPWTFVLLFALMVLGWDKHIRLPGVVSARLGRAFMWSRNHHGGSGLVLGLGTPLLPCGPLYLVLASMMFSGSALQGAILMGAFALGTTGLLLFLQLNMGWVSGRLNPVQLFWLRRGFAFSAVMMMVWRASQDSHLFEVKASCPFCP